MGLALKLDKLSQGHYVNTNISDLLRKLRQQNVPKGQLLVQLQSAIEQELKRMKKVELDQRERKQRPSPPHRHHYPNSTLPTPQVRAPPHHHPVAPLKRKEEKTYGTTNKW